MLTVTCPRCGARIEGLLDYENHARAHERFPAGCLGCAWDAWTLRAGELAHLHDDAEDGPRAGCCEHTH